MRDGAAEPWAAASPACASRLPSRRFTTGVDGPASSGARMSRPWPRTGPPGYLRRRPPTDSVRRVVFTGGPGAGKTTLLDELRSRGHATIGDSARAIIADRLRRNLSPRPGPREFAEEILRRDVENYTRLASAHEMVFYDRGVVDALCMLDEAAPLARSELTALLTTYAYDPRVFVFPPWRDIYTNDAERDQTFGDAERVHDHVTRWYRTCGYELIEVPRGSVHSRSQFVMRVLGRSDA